MNHSFALSLFLMVILASCGEHTNYKIAVSSTNKMPEFTKFEKIKSKYDAHSKGRYSFDLQSDKSYLFTQNYKLLVEDSCDMALITNSDYAGINTTETKTTNIRSVVPFSSRILYIIYNKDKVTAKNIKDLFENRTATIISHESEFIKTILSDFGVNLSKVNFLKSKVNVNNESKLDSASLDSILKIDFFNYYKENVALPYDIEVGFASKNFSSDSRLSKLLASHPELSFYSLDDFSLYKNGSKAEGFCLRNKFFTPFLLPKGSYGEYPESPIITIREDFLLAARDDVDDKFIYEFVKIMVEETDVIDGSTYGANFENVNFTFPFHEGTRRYLDKDAPNFFEKYGQVIGKLGAGVGGFYTALMGFLLWQKRRKRKTIVVDFKRILEIQAELGKAKSTEDLEKMYDELQVIEQDYHLKMIQHKILVDDTLQIFFVLIDKIEGYILAELKKRKNVG